MVTKEAATEEGAALPARPCPPGYVGMRGVMTRKAMECFVTWVGSWLRSLGPGGP